MSTGFNESIVFSPRSAAKGYQYRNKMGMIESAEFAVFFDDFLATVATNVPTGWSAAIIDTGATITLESTAGSLGASGVLKIASDGTSEGAAAYRGKGVQLTSGKRFFLEARVQTSDANQTDLFIGLSDLTATTNPEDLWTTTAANLAVLGTLAGSAYPSMLADLSNSGTTAQTQTVKALSDSTWHVLAIYYDGNTLHGYVDGEKVLTWSGAVATTVPAGVAMSPVFGARTGATAGNVVYVDYVRYVLER